jgi:hypothetical protein
VYLQNLESAVFDGHGIPGGDGKVVVVLAPPLISKNNVNRYDDHLSLCRLRFSTPSRGDF